MHEAARVLIEAVGPQRRKKGMSRRREAKKN